MLVWPFNHQLSSLSIGTQRIALPFPTPIYFLLCPLFFSNMVKIHLLLCLKIPHDLPPVYKDKDKTHHKRLLPVLAALKFEDKVKFQSTAKCSPGLQVY